MKWTRTLIVTQRDNPQEAEIPSHRLMIRAGMMRKLASGLYTFLPLGLRVLRKVEAIVREELNRAGAIEILMPILQPRNLWERSGRWGTMDDIMLKARTHQGQELVLGPTHEEVITDLVSREISSYKQLPINLYQINTKFRDEIRPRFGVMRSREFIMKDGYSFDADDESADRSYQLMYDAYTRIFARCGLTAMAVEADTGVMGGNQSHEFMVPADTGEDSIVVCPDCGYAANVEQAEIKPESRSVSRTEKAIEEIDTPDIRTVGELAEFFHTTPDKFIKTMIYTADGEPVTVLIRGDRDINEGKLRRLLGADELDLADEETIKKVTGAPLGFAGPVGLEGVRILADHTAALIESGITGANRADKHIINVNLDRDCAVEKYHDLARAGEGDLCPGCGTPMSLRRGIEVGHVFKLGTKYSEAMGAMVKDETGGEKPAIMGCYGIGISRTVAAIIEQHFDENGIIWPVAVAPYRVLILAINPDDPEVGPVAEGLYEDLNGKGMEVLYDNRKASAGVKFKDSDLIGIPFRITVGKRAVQSGVVEIKRRDSEEVIKIPPEEVPGWITDNI
ncbi:MAG: proline--tRNA ligase [Candidatus Auribacterota bacterium]|nr:proline--tRNA ligase [Candidatus Auribacterota bacterium]